MLDFNSGMAYNKNMSQTTARYIVKIVQEYQRRTRSGYISRYTRDKHMGPYATHADAADGVRESFKPNKAGRVCAASLLVIPTGVGLGNMSLAEYRRRTYFTHGVSNYANNVHGYDVIGEFCKLLMK